MCLLELCFSLRICPGVELLDQMVVLGFPGGSDGKESACQCRRTGFDPWVRKIPWRREWIPIPVFFPGEFHGQRSLKCLQFTGLQKARNDVATNTFQSIHSLSVYRKDPLEEDMATNSSILAWRILWTKEPVGLQSMALQRVRHD